MQNNNVQLKLTTYKWYGVDAAGNQITGEIKAINKRCAQAELITQKILVKKINRSRRKILSLFSQKISNRDITLILRQLTTLLVAGIPLLQALNTIASSCTNLQLQQILISIKNNIKNGCTLTESIQQHPKYFDKLTCALIFTGEQSGTLDQVLERAVIHREKMALLKQKVTKTLFYPGAVITIAFMVTYILLIFVVPQFAELFSGFGAQLPLLTQIVIGISNLLRQFWWLILLSLTVLFWSLFIFKRHCTTFTKKFDTFILRAPIFGKILQKAIVTRLMQTLAITFTAGVPLLEALQLLRNIANNAYFHRVLGEVHASICKGQTLSQSLRMSKLLPNIALQMVAIGEEAGKLPHMLAKAASFYENEVNQLVDNLSQLLEPLIMAVLGIIVGGLVIAMYLPIFKLGTVI